MYLDLEAHILLHGASLDYIERYGQQILYVDL
jgi:hypothetical protein